MDIKAIPVITENDSVATDEFFIGENDTLAAIVAVNIDADIVVLLTDIDGLYTSDPRKDKNAKLISEVTEITDDIMSFAGGSGSKFGTGGMITKVNAAKIAMESGCDLIVAGGSDPDVLYDVVEGKSVGTRFISGGGNR